jgi:hypothetical protein
VAFLLADQQKSTESGLKASKFFVEMLMHSYNCGEKIQVFTVITADHDTSFAAIAMGQDISFAAIAVGQIHLLPPLLVTGIHLLQQLLCARYIFCSNCCGVGRIHLSQQLLCIRIHLLQ